MKFELDLTQTDMTAIVKLANQIKEDHIVILNSAWNENRIYDIDHIITVHDLHNLAKYISEKVNIEYPADKHDWRFEAKVDETMMEVVITFSKTTAFGKHFYQDMIGISLMIGKSKKDIWNFEKELLAHWLYRVEDR